MKKKLFGVFLILALLLASLSVTAQAAATGGEKEWTVTFTAAGKVESNFKSSQFQDDLEGMEPGDELPVKIKLDNQYKDAVEWYMMNTIIESLEDANKDVTSGGAYTYQLTYKDSSGKDREVYNSKRVGGEDTPVGYPVGLHGVKDALKNYFYLETMPSGKNGTVTLLVKLDGDSQGIRYQNTKGALQMRFAAQLPQSRMIVRVGDDTNRTPYYVALGASGAILLALAIIGTKRRKEKGGTQQ